MKKLISLLLLAGASMCFAPSIKAANQTVIPLNKEVISPIKAQVTGEEKTIIITDGVIIIKDGDTTIIIIR